MKNLMTALLAVTVVLVGCGDSPLSPDIPDDPGGVTSGEVVYVGNENSQTPTFFMERAKSSCNPDPSRVTVSMSKQTGNRWVASLPVEWMTAQTRCEFAVTVQDLGQDVPGGRIAYPLALSMGDGTVSDTVNITVDNVHNIAGPGVYAGIVKVEQVDGHWRMTLVPGPGVQ